MENVFLSKDLAVPTPDHHLLLSGGKTIPILSFLLQFGLGKNKYILLKLAPRAMNIFISS